MSAFLVDENLPRSLSPALREAGLESHDVRDLGLRGRPDPEVLQLSLDRGLVLVTGDLGFGRLLRNVPTFPGVVLVRLPDEWPTAAVNETITAALTGLLGLDLSGRLAVVEPDRVRLHLLHPKTS